MKSLTLTKKNPLLWLLWFAEGTVTGFGAILPGISGGTLCVAFGMYQPVIETVSDLINGLKKYGVMLVAFFTGVACGFVGLSGLAAFLIDKNSSLVTCAFIGFILGTMPELWNDAGTEGRTKGSFVALILAFFVMLAVLLILKGNICITINADIKGFLLCGFLWGISFIVPGLSSSSLLLFFNLYQPMLRGIAAFDITVLTPLLLGMAVCLIVFSKGMSILYKKYYSFVSHAVLGIVAATAVMIFPTENYTLLSASVSALLIIAGALLAFGLTRICNSLKKSEDDKSINKKLYGNKVRQYKI